MTRCVVLAVAMTVAASPLLIHCTEALARRAEIGPAKGDQEVQVSPLYAETYRPQFHFTPAHGWTNDPNGLVYYKGEYHLFFQHNPFATVWGNMTWGHAVSRDLVHWRQLTNVLEPDRLGTMFSGSAVVDAHNTSGFQSGKELPLVAAYTAAGDTSPESKSQPFTQCVAYSNDRGRSWTKYARNPVVPHIIGGNRDPKVVWYAPTRRWIMALFLDGNTYALFSSPDLKTWTKLQELPMPDCGECPDFFEMPVAGAKPSVERSPAGTGVPARKWVFTSASGRYYIGRFNGEKFTPEVGPLQVDFGANYYAVQTYSDIPASDGRRIQIAWMNGGSYPKMPFNQQMSFPCTLRLRQTPDGLRLFRTPVKEISRLYSTSYGLRNLQVVPTAPASPIPQSGAESTGLWDVEAVFEAQTASAFGLRVRGETVEYSPGAHTVTCLGHSAPLQAERNRIALRVLVDRTSLEVFGNGGRVSLTSCYLARSADKSVEAYSIGGSVKLVSLSVHELRSAWTQESVQSAIGSNAIRN